MQAMNRKTALSLIPTVLAATALSACVGYPVYPNGAYGGAGVVYGKDYGYYDPDDWQYGYAYPYNRNSYNYYSYYGYPSYYGWPSSRTNVYVYDDHGHRPPNYVYRPGDGHDHDNGHDNDHGHGNGKPPRPPSQRPDPDRGWGALATPRVPSSSDQGRTGPSRDNGNNRRESSPQQKPQPGRVIREPQRPTAGLGAVASRAVDPQQTHSRAPDPSRGESRSAEVREVRRTERGAPDRTPSRRDDR